MPSALSLDKLEDRRRHLVRFIEQHAPQGSPNNRVTIVFDGDLDIFGGMTSTTAKIIFSQGESADDKIKRIVSQAENVKNVVVVSDDKNIQYAVRALGARVSGTKAFLDKAKPSGQRKRMPSKDSGRKKGSLAGNDSLEPEKRISKSDEFEITSEFGKIWLKSKGQWED